VNDTAGPRAFEQHRAAAGNGWVAQGDDVRGCAGESIDRGGGNEERSERGGDDDELAQLLSSVFAGNHCECRIPGIVLRRLAR
jgi:hypothetical protein